MRKLDTLFLDRDGVINVKLEGRYVRNSSEFDFMPKAKIAIAHLSKVFKRIIVVTNQQGIGKGIMSVQDLNLLHDYMLQQLREKGANIEKIYYCPHLSTEGCMCRKPNPGMIKQATIDFPDLDLNQSYLVGDSDSDILAGNIMGLITVKVDNKYTLSSWCEDFFRFRE